MALLAQLCGDIQNQNWETDEPGSTSGSIRPNRSPRSMSRQLLKVSRIEDSTTSLGNSCQHLIIFTVKKNKIIINYCLHRNSCVSACANCLLCCHRISNEKRLAPFSFIPHQELFIYIDNFLHDFWQAEEKKLYVGSYCLSRMFHKARRAADVSTSWTWEKYQSNFSKFAEKKESILIQHQMDSVFVEL